MLPKQFPDDTEKHGHIQYQKQAHDRKMNIQPVFFVTSDGRRSPKNKCSIDLFFAVKRSQQCDCKKHRNSHDENEFQLLAPHLSDKLTINSVKRSGDDFLNF
jgi:hypothetical protein